MIAFRRAHPVLGEERFYTDADIRWFDPDLGSPDWMDPKEKRLACLIHEAEGAALFLMFNAGADVSAFRVPPASNGARWYLAVATDREPPQDLFDPGEEALFDAAHAYAVAPRSSVILLRRRGSLVPRAQEASPGPNSRNPADDLR
jgi:glycogen operon protein